MNLANMSSVLHRAEGIAAEAYEDLYDLWFDAQGNMTHYLHILKKEWPNRANKYSVSPSARVNATQAFKGFYDLWFDEQWQSLWELELRKRYINPV